MTLNLTNVVEIKHPDYQINMHCFIADKEEAMGFIVADSFEIAYVCDRSDIGDIQDSIENGSAEIIEVNSSKYGHLIITDDSSYFLTRI